MFPPWHVFSVNDRLSLSAALLSLSSHPFLSKLLTTQPTTRTRIPSRWGGGSLPLLAVIALTPATAPRASFAKKQIDYIGPSLCLRWEAKVIFYLKFCPSLKGRTPVGSDPSFALMLCYLAQGPPTSRLQEHWNCVLILHFSPHACWPPLHFSMAGMSLGYTSLYLCGTTQDLLHIRHYKYAFLNSLLKEVTSKLLFSREELEGCGS